MHPLTRRELLRRCSLGFGGVALSGLLSSPVRRRMRTWESRALSGSLASAEAEGRLERRKASVRRSSRS
ncbi:MAG: hypothetical protein ACKOIB_01415 [Verrucomicrobiota bacterium]